MSNYYICIDNFKLEPLSYKVHFDWTDEFIGRTIKPDFYDRFDEFDETFLHGEELAFKGNYFNIETKIKDNIITDIEYGKYHDHGIGHGRPITDDVKITKKELKTIREFYDSQTVESTQEQYDNLINELESDKVLPGGYHYVKATSKGITVNDINGNAILINKNSLTDSIAISHSYIDVLFNRKILESNPDLFDQEIIDPLLAILSRVDYSSYQKIDRLLKQANNRKAAETAEDGYKNLLKCVIDNDAEKAKEFASYAAITDKDTDYEDTPLNIAVRNNNNQIVKTLVDNGACLLHNSAYKNRCTAIQAAIENRYYECQKILSDVLSNYNDEVAPFYVQDIYKALYFCNDFKTIKIVFPSTIGKCKFVMDAAKFENAFGIDELCFFADLKGASILWDLRNIEKAYQENRDLALKLVSQGCSEDVVDYFIEKDDYDLFECSIRQQNKTYSPKNHEKAYSLIFGRDERWYKTAEDYTEIIQFDKFLRSSLEQINQNDRATFYKTVKRLSLPIGSLGCVAEEISEYIKNNQIEEMKSFMEEYKIETNNLSFSKSEPYIEKMPEDQKRELILFFAQHRKSPFYNNYYSYQFDTIKDIGKSSDYLTNYIMANLPEDVSASIIGQFFEFNPKYKSEVVARFKELIGAAVFYEKKTIGSVIIDKALEMLDTRTFEDGHSISDMKWEMMRYLFIIERNSIIGLTSPRKKDNQEEIVKTVDALSHHFVDAVDLDTINFENHYYLSSKEKTLKELSDFEEKIMLGMKDLHS